MSPNNDHIRVVYVIRRAPNTADDSELWIKAKKKIQETFDGKIVPFKSGDLKHITLENTGFRIRVDKHDYNSFRIDVNILETDDPLMVVNSMLLATIGLAELNKISESKLARCFISFELTSNGVDPKEIAKLLDRKSSARSNVK